MTPSLRWAAMRPILMFHNCEGQSHRTVSTYHIFWREGRAEPDLNRGPSAYQPKATGSLVQWPRWNFYSAYPAAQSAEQWQTWLKKHVGYIHIQITISLTHNIHMNLPLPTVISQKETPQKLKGKRPKPSVSQMRSCMHTVHELNK